MCRLLISTLLVATTWATWAVAADKPNFVWLLSEDNSIHYMDLYDSHGAPTPRIAELARAGLLFEHAFSNAPVCSAARTTLMTSCFGPRIGTHFHRKSVLVPMPPGLRMFPAYLRQAGYYTTNNQKKDYNAEEGQGVWDASSAKPTGDSVSQTNRFFTCNLLAQRTRENCTSLNLTSKTGQPTRTSNPCS